MSLYEQVRAALGSLNLDVPAAALDRAAAVAVCEIEIGSTRPVLAAVTGAEWVTIKASADSAAVTVGSLARGTQVLVGQPEGSWRPVYGQPLGWVSANLVTVGD